MSNAAKAQQEPTMEEILASIRRIISDDTQAAEAAPAKKPKAAAAVAPKAAEPAQPPAAAAAEEEDGLNQDDIDAVFASMDAGEPEPEPEPEEARAEDEPGDVLELTDDMSDWNAALEESQAAQADPDDEPEAEAAPELVEPVDVVFEEADIEPVAAEPVRSAPPPAAPIPAMSTQAMTDSLLSPLVGAAVSSSFGSLSRTLLNQNPRTLEDLVADMLRPMLKDWLDQNLPTLVERMVRAEIERVTRGGS